MDWRETWNKTDTRNDVTRAKIQPDARLLQATWLLGVHSTVQGLGGSLTT